MMPPGSDLTTTLVDLTPIRLWLDSTQLLNLSWLSVLGNPCKALFLLLFDSLNLFNIMTVIWKKLGVDAVFTPEMCMKYPCIYGLQSTLSQVVTAAGRKVDGRGRPYFSTVLATSCTFPLTQPQERFDCLPHYQRFILTAVFLVTY